MIVFPKYYTHKSDLKCNYAILITLIKSHTYPLAYEVTTGNRPKASSMTFDGPGALGNDANPERSDSSVYILNADKIESSRADNG